MNRSRHVRRALCAATAFVSIAQPLRAADVVSQWLGVSGSWNDAANWSNTPAVAEYPNNGNGGFTYDANIGVTTATLSGNIALELFSLVPTTPTISTGIAGTGDITADDFQWTGGSLSGSGTLFVSNSINIGSGPANSPSMQRSITSSGTTVWTGTKGIFGSGTFNNLSGALFDCQNDGLSGSTAFGVGTINNSGTFRKSAGTETRVAASTFNNTGTVEVDATFALRFNSPGITQYASNVLTGGTWDVAGTLIFPTGTSVTTIGSGASVTLDGTGSTFSQINNLASVLGTFAIDNSRNFTAAGVFDNGGTVNVGAGSTLALPGGGTHVGTFGVSAGGTLDLSGGTHTFNLGSQITGGQAVLNSGTIAWTGGMVAVAALNVAAAGNLVISTSGSKTLPGVINNSGAAAWSANSGVFGNGTFNNLAGAVFLVQTSGGNAWGVAFNNSGLVQKTSGSASNFGGACDFSNTGTVEVMAGTLNINGDIAQHTGSALTGGTWNVYDDAILTMAVGSDITTTSPGVSVTLSGDGSIFTRINALANNQGAFTITAGRVFTTAGAFANSGILTVGPASVFRAAGVVHDSGTLTIDATGKLNLTDQKLITSDPLGTWDGSAYTDIAGLVDTGRGNAANAQWDGNGIVTTDTRAVNNNDLCSIGVAKASQVKNIADTETALFAGQTVLGSDTLAMFTWGGDANLDGKINIDDYGQIDFNVGSSGSVFGWFNGDFNYDGRINIDDYGIIDFNISAQTGTFPTAGGLAGVAAVPEPAAVALLAPAVALLRRQRRAWISPRHPDNEPSR